MTFLSAKPLGASTSTKSQLRAVNGAIVGLNGARLAYRDLVRDQLLSVDARATSPLTATVDFTVMNCPVPRIDIPAKVTGGPAYIQDMRPSGVLHGRMVRPPSPGAKLDHVDTSAVERMPGVVKVVRDGDVLSVIADDEWGAISGDAPTCDRRGMVGDPDASR